PASSGPAPASPARPGDRWRLAAARGCGDTAACNRHSRVPPMSQTHGTTPRQRGPIVRVLVGAWDALNFTRRLVFNLLFLLQIGPLPPDQRLPPPHGRVTDGGWLPHAAAVILPPAIVTPESHPCPKRTAPPPASAGPSSASSWARGMR